MSLGTCCTPVNTVWFHICLPLKTSIFLALQLPENIHFFWKLLYKRWHSKSKTLVQGKSRKALMTLGKDLFLGLFFHHIMDIGFPWVTRRLHFLVVGSGLAFLQHKSQENTGGWLFYLKVENRFALVDYTHIPLAMWAMFQSKRKLAEKMVSQKCTLMFSCQWSATAVWICRLKPRLSVFSFKLVPLSLICIYYLPAPSACLRSANQAWTDQSTFFGAYR